VREINKTSQGSTEGRKAVKEIVYIYKVIECTPPLINISSSSNSPICIVNKKIKFLDFFCHGERDQQNITRKEGRKAVKEIVYIYI